MAEDFIIKTKLGAIAHNQSVLVLVLAATDCPVPRGQRQGSRWAWQWEERRGDKLAVHLAI
ncbi:hypothetical protein NECAME_00161 [Necator americanus]|uniref:Uncharacterized protein n=1 Tax=Necator americanus TaxID=51031 RepID=W2U1V6_NECAM|nr:hypothetical protein NECAME_00161 [Necator americanus]ETN87302.1 hypothetical protein NECAME_00161 [Necator americanus]